MQQRARTSSMLCEISECSEIVSIKLGLPLWNTDTSSVSRLLARASAFEGRSYFCAFLHEINCRSIKVYQCPVFVWCGVFHVRLLVVVVVWERTNMSLYSFVSGLLSFFSSVHTYYFWRTFMPSSSLQHDSSQLSRNKRRLATINNNNKALIQSRDTLDLHKTLTFVVVLGFYRSIIKCRFTPSWRIVSQPTPLRSCSTLTFAKCIVFIFLL